MALRGWQDKAQNGEVSGNLGSAASASGQTAGAACNASFPGAKHQLSEVQFPHLHSENYHTSFPHLGSSQHATWNSTGLTHASSCINFVNFFKSSYRAHLVSLFLPTNCLWMHFLAPFTLICKILISSIFSSEILLLLHIIFRTNAKILFLP